MAAGPWALVQFTTPGSATTELGVDVGGSVRLPPAELRGVTLMQVLDDWARWTPVLRDLDAESLTEVPGARLAAPLTYPRKVLCAGANYYDHAEEMGTERPDPDATPFFFLKTPTTTIVGTGTPVAIPVDPEAGVDWEAELGVVIADTCRDLDAADARAHIAGYVVANDLSARGRFPRPDAVFPPFGWDWFAHKNQDGFCPIGPGMVPAWLVPDPQELKIRLTVNGEVKQDSTTAAMVTGVDKLVAAASRVATLEPGDLVLTGTPAGVGMPRQEFLKPGDVVTVEIEGLGHITNEIVARR
jgi:2-keto-4-pentenoate hydratase/2-oxohepta-3-ene-1,7-dioic acid hydratase in catechol pathway